MKVDRKGPQAPSVGGAGAVQPAAGAPTPTSSQANDQVSVSETARQLAQLRAAVGDVEPDAAISAAKVEGLRSIMAKGQYSADLEDVARKLLRDALGGLLR